MKKILTTIMGIALLLVVNLPWIQAKSCNEEHISTIILSEYESSEITKFNPKNDGTIDLDSEC